MTKYVVYVYSIDTGQSHRVEDTPEFTQEWQAELLASELAVRDTSAMHVYNVHTEGMFVKSADWAEAHAAFTEDTYDADWSWYR
jgi:hypothetical protein